MIPKLIKIGYEGEKAARHVDIDITDLLTVLDGNPSLMHRRPTDTEAYAVPFERIGSVIRWTFSDLDSDEEAWEGGGKGEAQITITSDSGDQILKSGIMPTSCDHSLTFSEDTPEPYKAWVDQVLAAGAAAIASAAAAADSETSAAGSATAAADSASAAAGSETAAQTAKEAAQSAQAAAETAQKKAEDAAEESITTHGIMDFSINDAGHLIYNASENISGVDFNLVNGRMIATYD